MPQQTTYNSTLHKIQLPHLCTNLQASSCKKDMYALRHNNNNHCMTSSYTLRQPPYPYPISHTHTHTHTHTDACPHTDTPAEWHTQKHTLAYTNRDHLKPANACDKMLYDLHRSHTDLYILAVLPSSSGRAISGAVVGYVMGIYGKKIQASNDNHHTSPLSSSVKHGT